MIKIFRNMFNSTREAGGKAAINIHETERSNKFMIPNPTSAPTSTPVILGFMNFNECAVLYRI
jgi:hypothetical protein